MPSAVEIVIDTPSRDVSDEFWEWANGLPNDSGIEPSELMRKALHVDGHQLMIFIAEGGAAVAGVATAAKAIMGLLKKDPTRRTRLRVTFTAQIKESDLAPLKALGCEIEFEQGPTHDR